ncbi:MAG: sugar phosphate isomerase/epimerase [Clostridia bacterium]|nr:sugar phosphate isomerase/epimerase [Clostridia bacterium]
MKLGVLTNLLGNEPADQAFAYFASLGIEELEVGCGGYPGKDHCDPQVLLHDEKKLQEFKELFAKYGLKLNCLSCHGNPVHPNKETAKFFRDEWHNAVLLAEKLGIKKIVGFSGCPGDCEGAKYPNWVTCPWPNDFGEVLNYQWNEVLVPYWKEEAAFCAEHGIEKIAFEMHPGFCVYNPETLLRLRAEVGPIIGANFDPSHLIWQGIDPVAAIRKLAGAIYHVHAKDTKIDEINTSVNGVLDTKSYADEINRSWIFRAVGYGHDSQYWRDMISALRLAGYDDILSIEHEDSLMMPKEGLEKTVAFLKASIIKAPSPNALRWV